MSTLTVALKTELTLSDPSLAARNYVITNTFRKGGIRTTTPGQMMDAEAVNQTVTYLDGMGRPLQQIQTHGSTDSSDLVQFFQYDAEGRALRSFSPFPAAPVQKTGGYFHPDAATAYASFYAAPALKYGVAPSAMPYAQTKVEASPYNRVLEQGGWGALYQPNGGRTKRTFVRYYAATDPWLPQAVVSRTGSVSLGARYQPGSGLLVQVTIDPQGDSLFSYLDREGRLIATRQPGGATSASDIITLNVYDSLGRQALTITPLAYQHWLANGKWTAPPQAVLDGWCFQFRYDARGRLNAQKAPGKQWEYIVYDRLGAPVLTFLRERRQGNATLTTWRYTKTDAAGRSLLSGEYVTTLTQAQLQAQFDADTAPLFERRAHNGTYGYTNSAKPTLQENTTESNGTTYTDAIFYYDDSDFDRNGRQDSLLKFSSSQPAPGGLRAFIPGQQTGLKTRPLREYATSKAGAPAGTGWALSWTWTVSLYDTLARKVLLAQQRYELPSKWQRSSMSYSWDGRLLNTTQSADSLGVTYSEIYEYDALGRTSRVKGGSLYLAASHEVRYWYDAFSRVRQKRTGPLTVKYTRNEYGQVSRILYSTAAKPRLFEERLGYADSLGAGSLTPRRYDGLIAYTWTHDGILGKTFLQKYQYDRAKRLTAAYFDDSTKGIAPTAADGIYSEYDMQYDVAGNILGLKRSLGVVPASGKPPRAQHLSFGYFATSHRLAFVNQQTTGYTATAYTYGPFYELPGSSTSTLAAPDYTYDADGNLLSDLNTAQNATYNSLQLPRTLTKNGVSVEYVYDGAGRMLVKNLVVPGSVSGTVQTTTNIYAAGATFVTVSGIPGMRVQFAGTDVNVTASGSQYTVTDHLGSTRMVVKADGTVEERYHYYAWGARIATLSSTPSSSTPTTDFFAQGKRIAEELESAWQLHGARLFDASIGRFLAVDLLAAQTADLTPYHYTANNPLNFKDASGLEAEEATPGNDTWNWVMSLWRQFLASDAQAMRLNNDGSGGWNYTLTWADGNSYNGHWNGQGALGVGWTLVGGGNPVQAGDVISSPTGVGLYRFGPAEAGQTLHRPVLGKGMVPIDPQNIRLRSSQDPSEWGRNPSSSRVNDQNNLLSQQQNSPYRVFVLNDVEGAQGAGHVGIAVSNGQKFYLYSRNGAGGRLFGDPVAPDIGTVADNFGDFQKLLRDRNYDRGFSFSLSYQQYMAIRVYAQENAGSFFITAFTDCLDLVVKALRAASYANPYKFGDPNAFNSHLLPNKSFKYMMNVYRQNLDDYYYFEIK